MEINVLRKQILTYVKQQKFDAAKVRRACDLAQKEHAGQTRKSGEPYIIHPFSVACYLAEHQADEDSLIAAILHDVVEDTDYTLPEIKNNFGADVANLINGLTKFDKNRFRDAETLDRKIETLRKMFALMQKDIRIIAVKLFDRLHNLRTLGAIRPEKRRRIAQESLDVYTVLASHLGIWKLKKEFEDLCFLHLNKESYTQLEKDFEPIQQKQQKIFRKIKQKIFNRERKIVQDLSLINKSLFSLYRRSQKENGFDLLSRQLTIKIIVSSRRDCYQILHLLHSLGKVQEGAINDYIALPQENGYRSLHTAIVDDKGNLIKFHIRTPEMEESAEKGILTFCFNKSKQNIPAMPWLKNIAILDQNTQAESLDFWNSLKNDILKERISIIGEKGKIVRLPHSSTIMDYVFEAYADEKAKFLKQVYVNAKPVPLNHTLMGGEHIKTTFSQTESLDLKWLSLANNAFSKNKIKKLLQADQRNDKKEIGEGILQREFDVYKLGFISEIGSRNRKKLLNYYKVNTFDEILIKIAEGEIAAEEVREQVLLNGKNRFQDENFAEKIHLEIWRENNLAILTAIFENFKNNQVDFVHQSSVLKGESVRDNFLVTGCRVNAFNEIKDNLERIQGVKRIKQVFPNMIRKNKIYMIIVTIAWIINPLAIWYLAQQGLSAGTSAGIRLWGSVFILGIIVFIQKLRTGIAFENIKFSAPLVVVSVNLAIHIHLVHTAITNSVPGQYMTIADISTGIIALYYILGSRKIKKMSQHQKLFALLTFVGLSAIGVFSLFFNSFSIDESSFSNFSKGHLLALLVVIVVMIYTILNNKLFSKEKIKRTGVSMMFVLFFIAAIVQAPFINWEELILFNKKDILIGFANGILAGGIGHVLYFYSANFLKHYFLTLCLGLVLPFVALFDFLIFKNITPWGFILVFIGIIYTAYLEKNSKH